MKNGRINERNTGTVKLDGGLKRSKPTSFIKLTETEKRVLINLHLRGITGHMGNMNKKQRLSLLNGLVSKGYMNINCDLTEKGIKVTRPSYNTL